MTTTVGIFDNMRDLERAVEQLANAGIEDTVYDEAILAQETGPAPSASTPESGPGVLLRSVQPNLPLDLTGTLLSGHFDVIWSIITCPTKSSRLTPLPSVITEPFSSLEPTLRAPASSPDPERLRSDASEPARLLAIDRA
jgi:hypothetical protein